MNYTAVYTAIRRRRPLNPRQTTPTSAGPRLKRSLSLVDLIFYGVGCSVGAGIYSLVGIGADLAGPSIAISFLLCGVACCFTSLAYAEFAARVPLAGSAYTFTYVTFGELCGWLVGWNLTLGYAISAAAVARSWAEYVVTFLEALVGKHWALTRSTHFPLSWFGSDYECCPLAMAIIAFCTTILVTGAKESTRFNTAMTIMNLLVLGFVLLVGSTTGTIQSDNLTPIFPHGVAGMARGAGLVFFSYLGFDMCSCLSEEVKNPERNMPIGIVGSLLLSLSIYVAVSIVVLGMAPVNLLGEDVPIVNALLANACCSHVEQLTLADAKDACLSYSCSPIVHPMLHFGSRIISFGAMFGLTAATFACLMGQPRVFYTMAQDGLFFKVYARVHPKTGVPTIGTVLTGIATALVACLIDLEPLANAISLGTLQVFTFVNAGVIILRTSPPPTLEISTNARSQDQEPASDSSLFVGDANTATLGRKKMKPHWLTLFFTIGAIFASAGVAHEKNYCMVFVPTLVCIICGCFLFQLPKSPRPDTFACPMVPVVPMVGIIFNSYMMGSMSLSTWAVVMLWLCFGLLFYFVYGIHRSKLRITENRSGASDQNERLEEVSMFPLLSHAESQSYDSLANHSSH
eukprot:scaffold22575_cov141-Cylindrotheca_fusiformis.AAC.19